jgi:hypothetical protein
VDGIPVLAADGSSGDLYIVERFAGIFRIRKFDGGGTQVMEFGDGGTRILCAAGWPVGSDVDSAHNVYVGMTCIDAVGVLQSTVWKLDQKGQPVTTFGTGGSRSAIFGPDADATTPRVSFVRVGADGSVYVAGASDRGGCPKFVIAKMDAEGRDVTSFGTGGRLVLDLPDSTAMKIEFDGQGRLYALGQSSGTCPSQYGAPLSYFVVRTGG